jgi:rhomboid protease GluP
MVNCEKYKPTYVLIALNVALYIAGALIGGDAIYTPDSVFFAWGQVNYFVIDFGWYWQLVTSLFHPRVNIPSGGKHAFLLIFGLRAEEMFIAPRIPRHIPAWRISGNLLYLATGVNAAPLLALQAQYSRFSRLP